MASTSQSNNSEKRLIVVIGPTAVGKSSYALELAQKLGTVIISADSRQVYKGLSIGTAAPSPAELQQVCHYFIHTLPVTKAYDASAYADDAHRLLAQLHESHPIVIMVGGSMLYLKAFLEGFDPVPEVDPQHRIDLWTTFEESGVKPLRDELHRADPEYLSRIDPNNHKRIIRALEVCRGTGQPFSSFHTGTSELQHPFEIEIHYIHRPRQALYERINRRVEEMFAWGLEEEARQFLSFRHENALNTIGYKELFQYLDDNISLEECKQLIKRNTRTFARQQERFFRRWIETPPASWKVCFPWGKPEFRTQK